MDGCEECGFVYAEVAAQAIAGRLREAGPRFAAAMAAVPEPRRRPAVGVWSPLEYVCHVRDVLRVQAGRVALALREDEPEFAPMGRAELAVSERYNEQEPRAVLAELAASAEEMAGVLDRLDAAGWARTGVYNWPAVEVRTMLWLGRHTVHEVEHHLMDVRNGGQDLAGLP
ncbi:DinB family protein [Actinoplanes sp. NPDC024001]|uniref:DinB family protein n=1 Tax=Actinoplanes sp. NPDC024001 TaxID=3154598 RepID=UPI0033D61E60